jgi:hypothetical protein
MKGESTTMGEDQTAAQTAHTDEIETKRAVKAAMAQHSKIIAGDDKETQQRCMDEVKGVLAKYDCVLVPRAILSPGNAEFIIEARKRPKGMEDQMAKMQNPYVAELAAAQQPVNLGEPAGEIEEPPLD